MPNHHQITLYGLQNYKLTATLFAEETGKCASCGIFHEPTVDVEFDDMPNYVTLFNTPMQTIELPCSHKFNSAALLRHFAVTNMQCPICRAGHPCKLDCTVIPPEFAAILQREQQKTLQEQQQQQQQQAFSNILMQEVVFNEQAWLRGFSIVMIIQQQSQQLRHTSIQRAVFASPLIINQLENQHAVFGVQQSMRRNVEVYFNQHCARNAHSNASITIQLMHESQQDVFAQLQLPQHMWMRFASQTLITRQLDGLFDLRHGNTTVGHVIHANAGANNEHWIQSMRICLKRDLISNLAMTYMLTWMQEEALYHGVFLNIASFFES